MIEMKTLLELVMKIIFTNRWLFLSTKNKINNRF